MLKSEFKKNLSPISMNFKILSLIFIVSLSQLSFAQVSTEWVSRYSGPSSKLNEATCIAIDAQGNSYIGGYSFSDANQEDYTTIKYGPDGKEIWTARYNGTANGKDMISAIAVDNSGNIYVTGSSEGKGSGFDCLTIKYNPDGTEAWVARFNSDQNKNDGAVSLAVDNDGNVYITGYSDSKKTGSDIVTLKYNSSGTQIWFSRFDNPKHTDDLASCLTLDGKGNLFIGGYSQISKSSWSFTILKYSESGSMLWNKIYSIPGSNFNQTKSIAADGNGNLYLAGTSSSKASKDDIAVLKYSPEGELLWQSKYNGPANNTDYPTAIIAGKDDNVYITGASKGNGTDFDYITLCYNSSGEVKWNARYNGQSNGSDIASCIAIDSIGAIYVSGSSWNGTDEDYATIKYNSLGAELWVAKYNGPGNSLDRATGIAADGTGNIYVTGFGAGSSGINEFATIKYSQTPSESAPGLVSPVSGSVSNSSPLLEWTSIKNANVYRLQVSADQSFYQTFIDMKFDFSSNRYKIPDSKLTSGSQYFWRVGALNAAGMGPWSEIWTFTVK